MILLYNIIMIHLFEVFAKPDEGSSCVGHRQHGEADMLHNSRHTVQVLRVIDFQGAWVRLAPETEAQARRPCPPCIEYGIEGWQLCG